MNRVRWRLIANALCGSSRIGNRRKPDGPSVHFRQEKAAMNRFTVRSSFGSLVVLPLISFLLLLALSPASGQTAIGIQQFGAYDGSPDTIDLGTLAVRLIIPIYRKAGRGNGT